MSGQSPATHAICPLSRLVHWMDDDVIATTDTNAIVPSERPAADGLSARKSEEYEQRAVEPNEVAVR